MSETASSRRAAGEVVPGVWSIRQPLENALRYVWAYALEVEAGVLLVDAGLDHDGHLANIESALSLFGAGLEDVAGVIFTHFHPDHYGLAERLRARTGAWLALHEVEAALIEEKRRRPLGRDEAAGWFEALGVSDGRRQELVELALGFDALVGRSARPDRTLRGGVPLAVDGERFEIVHTPGHSPGHVCIVDRRRGAVFSGDHVLARTTPNVGIYPGLPGSPLADYLRSLERVRPLTGLVDLPGHEERIEVGERAAQLVAYHADQLDRVAGLVADGCETVWAVAGQLWAEDWAQLSPLDLHLALGEAYAHLAVLSERGRLEQVQGRPLRWRT